MGKLVQQGIPTPTDLNKDNVIVNDTDTDTDDEGKVGF